MTLTVCIDDRNGMAFNRRRQSRDRVLIEDLIVAAAGRPIRISPYSLPLFPEGLPNLLVSEDPLGEASGEDFCFVETLSPTSCAEKFDRILLYRWNRHYPADLRFEPDLSHYTQKEVRDFVGSSHEKITKEVYER